MVVILSQKELKDIIDMKAAITLVEKAFKMHSEGTAKMPSKVYLTFPKGDMRAMPAYLSEGPINTAGVKVVTVHPENPKSKLPTVIGTTLLIDPDTGIPVSLMDATYLTALRTGAAGGVAIKYLAMPNSTIAAFVGAGIQAETQLMALMEVMPSIKEIRVADSNEINAKKFCEMIEKKHSVSTKITSVEESVKGAQIVITTTPVRKHLVSKAMVSPGTHINAIGADAQGKQELETSLIESSAVIADDWDQASHSGELNVPVHHGKFTKEMLRASLGDVVAGKAKGRKSKEEITIFDSTGLAIQDMIVSDYVVKQVKKNISGYLTVNLLE